MTLRTEEECQSMNVARMRQDGRRPAGSAGRHATRRPARRLEIAAVLACLIGLGICGPTAFAFVQMASAPDNDLAMRSPEIHWPPGHSPAEADLFAHNELLINAPCATVWQHIVAAPDWPQWYPNAHDVRILGGGGGALRRGTSFAWNTFDLEVESKVDEFVPKARIGWFGKHVGLDAYHTWLLSPAPHGCQVVTEEVVKGPMAVAMRKSDPDAMHKGHDLWLGTLKKVSEK